MLVKIAATKKCLNRTWPNGEIIILYKVFFINKSSVLKRYLNGLNIRMKKVMRTPIVNPAIALSKIFDIFITKVWQTKQNVQIPKRIVAIYNKVFKSHTTYPIKLHMCDFVFDFDFKNWNIVDAITMQYLKNHTACRYHKDEYKQQAKYVYWRVKLLERFILFAK